MKKYILPAVVLLLMLCALALPASAAETACPGFAMDSYNGLPACQLDGNLHICPINFPDYEFRNYLQRECDGNKDTVFDDDIMFYPILDLSNLTLTSLEGVGYFTNVTSLKCSNSLLTELDVSNLPNLTHLDCSNNNLQTLVLGNNSALKQLLCSNNQLTALELSGCPNLQYISCASNNLTKLDISCCPSIVSVDCGQNDLTEINISGCSQLANLYCGDNELSKLDLSNCPDLYYLRCNDNNLTQLNLSNNAKLYLLECQNNRLASLDLRGNPALKFFEGGEQEVKIHPSYTRDGLKLDLAKLVKPGQLLSATIEDDTEYHFNEISGTVTIPKLLRIRMSVSIPVASGRVTPTLDVTCTIGCEHDMSAATCIKVSTCKTCGFVTGQKLPHTFTEANCTTAATCRVCGFSTGETTPHIQGKWVTVTEATWDEPGGRVRNCEVCGIQLESETVDAIKNTPNGKYILQEKRLANIVKITRILDLLTFAAVILYLLYTIITDLMPPHKKRKQ